MIWHFYFVESEIEGHEDLQVTGLDSVVNIILKMTSTTIA